MTPIWMFIVLILVLIWSSMYGSIEGFDEIPNTQSPPPNIGIEESPIEDEINYTPLVDTPPVVYTPPSEDIPSTPGVEYKNRAGFVMHLGKGAYSDTYYCSQVLGQVKIPRSDGQCGPFEGPQCPDCNGYTIENHPNKVTNNLAQKNGLEYYNLYWNAEGESQDYDSNAKIVTSDCPECVDKSTGACINCGGSGGSGTLGSNGKSIVPKSKNAVTDLVKDTVSGTTGLVKYTASQGAGLVKDTVSGGVGLTKDVVSGGVGLAKDAVTGGVGLAKDTVTGGVGLAKDTVTGGVGLIKDTVKGGVGLVKDTVTGTKNILTSNKTGPKNPYTYNGALSDKGTSNFIPLTADFSAFGR